MVLRVNQTWEQRTSIRPSSVQRERPKVLELYKPLPRSNCQACGQPACLTFALQLAMGHERLATCPPLLTDGHRSNREQLQAVLDAAGLSGGLYPSG